MNETMLEYTVRRLQETKGNWPRISRAADVEYFWISRLVNGIHKNPSYHTVEKLAAYLKKIETKKANGASRVRPEGS